jgi:long-chain fatty acid transport protein
MRIIHLIVLATLCSPTFSYGLGFRLADMDAFATSRGNAFTATADNPSAIYYNPAGITQLDGLSMRLGAYGITFKDEFEPAAKGSKSTETIQGAQAVPSTYVVMHPKNSPVAFGYGVYAPYGLGLEWPDEAPFRTLARSGSITYIAINPTIALQVSRTFSIAAGFTVNYADAELQQGIAARGDNFKFGGDGVAYGFTLGALWQPTPQHSFGVKYHSATDFTLSGHTSAKLSDQQRAEIREGNAQIRKFRKDLGAFADAALTASGTPLEGYPERFPEEDADGEIHFPQFVLVGYSFRPTPQWNFEVNADWTDWDSLNTVTLHQQKSADIDIPFNYTSSIIWELGATRYFNNGVHVSAGYMYSENSVPDSQFSPGVPDADRHLFTTGVGHKGARFAWDIAYQLGYSPARDIDSDSSADGRYEFLSHAVTVSLGYNF